MCGFGICLRKQAINIAKEHALPKWHSKTVSKTLSLHQWLSNNSKSRSRNSDITWTAHATFVLLFSFTSFATEISGFYDAYPQTTCTLVKRQRYIDFSGRKIWKYLQKKKKKEIDNLVISTRTLVHCTQKLRMFSKAPLYSKRLDPDDAVLSKFKDLTLYKGLCFPKHILVKHWFRLFQLYNSSPLTNLACQGVICSDLKKCFLAVTLLYFISFNLVHSDIATGFCLVFVLSQQWVHWPLI